MDETISWLVKAKNDDDDDGGHSSLAFCPFKQEPNLNSISNLPTTSSKSTREHINARNTCSKQQLQRSAKKLRKALAHTGEDDEIHSNKRNESDKLRLQQEQQLSGNNKCNSYSNLFRQYLPLALSLNNNQSNNKSSSSKIQVIERTDQTDSYSRSTQPSKFIVNALNRLKFSVSSPTFINHQASSTNSVQRKNKASLVGSREASDSGEGESNEKRSETSFLLSKRRGFLYLKKRDNITDYTVRSLNYPIASSSNLQLKSETINQQQKNNLEKEEEDQNNNDISNLLHSDSINFQRYASVDECNNKQVKDLMMTKGNRKEQSKSKNWQNIGVMKEEQERMMRPAEVEVLRKRNNGTNQDESARTGKKRVSSKVAALLTLSVMSCLYLLVALLVVSQVSLAQQLASQQVPAPFRSQAANNGGIISNPREREQLPATGGRPQPAAGSLVANINCNKIKGHVTLTPNAQGGATVSTQISSGPTGEVYQWSIHQFPVKPGAAMCSCSPMILGAKLIDLSEMHGNLPGEQEFTVQSSLNLFGSDSPVGHSLMLRGMKTGMLACATFLPTSRKSTYRAKFHTPISGSVSIFQTAFGSSFISHLMYSNGSRRHSMHRFDLLKSEEDMVTSAPGNSPVLGGARALASQEQLAWEQREHEHELSQCKQLGAGEPLFKNISYQLSVSTENFGMRGRTAQVLPQIPFETFSSVFVVVYSEHDPSEPIACAPLRFVKPKTAAAKFQSVSVQGSVIFSQDSPYDPTLARINLNLPNSDGHSYGIDELPMIIRRKSDTRVCPNIREIIYNPHHIEPSSVPAEGEATSDQYAVGDLSGKYGSLTGKATEKITVSDYNLPLYGPISVVGRAMTIYSAEGVAIACSNIELTTPMTTAFATFDFGIQGQFIFRQPVNDCNGDTYVYIEVSKPVASGASGASAGASAPDSLVRSLDHNWHIHVNPIDSGLDHLSTTDCHSAGSHYNPYNTSTGSIYSRDCTPFNVLRCELGDLSAKMFTIEIPPYRVKGGQEPDIGKFFGTDIDLPLCGPVSIVNRSVVVHVPDFGHQRLACSTVIEFKPRV